MKKTTGILATGIAISTVGAMSCGSGEDGQVPTLSSRADLAAPALGGHLDGITDAVFADARAAFATVETIDDGVGPIFNETGCGNCHELGATGGAGDFAERRFGRFDPVSNSFDPLANEGGSLRQLQTLGTFTNSSGTLCNDPLEVEPADATVHNVGRQTTPLFGLGLVDAMPDDFFKGLSKGEPPAVRGTVSYVTVLLPNPLDRSQSIGATRVGRFGWKANVPNLVQFAADAYLNEMGITTQHCIGGVSVESFATESAPNGVPVAPGCDDNLPGTDDSVGACAPGQTEIQDDVAEFNEFMTFLAPTPPTASALAANAAGKDPGLQLFIQTGCADCHVRKTFVTPPNPANGVPGKVAFNPYSDFLLHDMGSLGDQIGNLGDSLATTRMMRTAPLWGIRFRTHLLHDGRATDVATAALAHDGQGAASAQAFAALSAQDRNALVSYVLSL